MYDYKLFLILQTIFPKNSSKYIKSNIIGCNQPFLVLLSAFLDEYYQVLDDFCTSSFSSRCTF